MQNVMPSHDGVAARIAAQTAARRTNYHSEVRALLDAALKVIVDGGTDARARVSDIVAVAGLSNDTFYRHFPSKDALIAALVEDGSERAAAHIGRRMAQEHDPGAQVKRWLDGVLAQTEGTNAETTLAVLWNSVNLTSAIPIGSQVSKRPLAKLLHAPFAELRSADPELDAELVTQAVIGRVAGHLWAKTTPSRAEAEHLLQFCLSVPRACVP
ncbi:TetR/AcrR family transcriptional regulator [Mycobacterium sp. 852002-51057_SCH5723018]|uniref:TetR/AcrR family transcriptional regulator n=1 Tax=Mycobacterium sp. 852002-51057_SCH5723018 TaxID=1834094 RepID=UPI000800F52F|nr:TetR/AcrR family transcriptional regulator [Mycobacterium sp. 852002-51057_SCH5723018]OBG30268.1 TetR family transcriptional regulator [Mycobacterium sp. 852002-51057_SCH5723018]